MNQLPDITCHRIFGIRRISHITLSMGVTTVLLLWSILSVAQQSGATNPIIFADVPDMSIIRVGENYYMSSTTMHMTPNVPVMRSRDLVNWNLINYACDTLADMDELNLENGKNTYGRGTWASCLRYHNGTYYLSTFAQTTNETYVFTTRDIEQGRWKRSAFKPALHDHSLFFDDDGRVYMIYGGGTLKLVELTADASGIKPGTSEEVIIENASLPSGDNIGLPAEGSQLFKVNGKYYLFNITWPKGGMRTVVVHRADNIRGPYEGRVALQDLGVAQGGLIDTPGGKWFAYLFRDYGSVGRIPYFVPVQWKDGWPILGVDGKVPDVLDLPKNGSLIPGIVKSDEFDRRKGEEPLPLVWQWNHNPDNRNWSVKERGGYLRLTTARVDTSFFQARNTLTQRTIGPQCSGYTRIDVTRMKDGDFAGLSVLQKRFGQIGVKVEGDKRWIVVVSAESERPVETAKIPLNGNVVFLKIDCNFKDMADTARFYFSLEGKRWNELGVPLHMKYTLPHFMGYRYGLFNYATKNPGGHVDFDFFRISGE
jgi:beta-xylosidase